MEATLAELLILVLVAAGIYRILRPLQEKCERAIVQFLTPGRKPVIDAEIIEIKKGKSS